MKIRGTSFADVADLLAFNRAVRDGKTQEQALSVGDNGLGASGLSTVAGTGCCVALHGHANLGRIVFVGFGGKEVQADVRDIAPDGVCDMNPDTCDALGLKPPVDVTVDLFFRDYVD